MYFAEIENIDLLDANLIDAQEMKTSIVNILNQLLPFECFSNEKLVQKACEVKSPAIFADLMIYHFNKRLFKEVGEIFSDEELTLYFNEPDTMKKLMALLKKLSIHLASEQTKLEINEKVKAVTSDMQRKWVLRQQAEALQNELESLQQKNQMPIDEEFKARIKAAGMSEEAEKVAWKQLERLKMIPRNSPEYAMTMTYLDWLCDLPWIVRTK
jgi:ATP-dependent Lon protease